VFGTITSLRLAGYGMKVRVHHNGDDVFIAWQPDGFIPACRGFALMRRRNGVEEVVSTWVGFAGNQVVDGSGGRRRTGL
jgi:hypothetical protein